MSKGSVQRWIVPLDNSLAIPLAQRVYDLKESSTVRLTGIIQKLETEGRKIFNFAVGEPDSSTSPVVIAATQKALQENKTRYSTVSGVAEFKKALCDYYKDGLDYTPSNVLITNGSKQTLYNIFQVICNPGDEVIIPRPYWVTFPQQVILAGAKPIFLNQVEHQLDLAHLEEVLSPRTKAIIINSPNNPSGAVYPRKTLEKIAELALQKNIYIIADEAYEFLLYDQREPFSISTLGSEIRERTITVKSFSKSFCMTGFRVGFAFAEKHLIQAMTKLQGHTTGNVCTFAQYGALAALSLPPAFLQSQQEIFEKRRNVAWELCQKIFPCIKPAGAFYLFPDVSSLTQTRFANDQELAEYILEESGVATVAGSSFGLDNHLRISFPYTEETLRAGFAQICKALQK